MLVEIDRPEATASPPSDDRIARRNGFVRPCLGEGRNGMVRYVREKVEAYEASRRVSMS